MVFPAPDTASADIGIVGIGVMGTSLARNLARHGHAVAAYNLTPDRTSRLLSEYGDEGTFVPAGSVADFVGALRAPRVAILLVPAGAPTDSAIAELRAHLEPGDIIIDSGNTLFTDTQDRAAALADSGLHFVGMGISGGEEGALEGPSMMPGGSVESYARIGPVLESIAARAEDGTPCCTHIGPDGAGHFVKTVHNGIEYADMQLIAEAYDLMRRALGMTVPEIRDVFDSWRATELDSYLIDITTDILGHVDAHTGLPFVDIVADVAAQKGTGAWTVKTALDVGIPVPTIAEATFARSLSGAMPERVSVQALELDPATLPVDGDRAAVVDAIRDALLASKISAYAQGFDEIQQASIDFNWGIDCAALARIWRAGCIIRAHFLNFISEAYTNDPALPSLLGDPWFSSRIASALPGWRRVVALSATCGVPAPAFGSSLAWFDALRSERLPTALVQAQRDYFGSHSYARVDRDGVFHTRWELEGRPEEQWS